MDTYIIILLVTLAVLIAALMFFIGNLNGFFMGEKINKEYFLGMNDITKDFFEKMMNLEQKYFQDVTSRLADAVDELNKSNEIPIWKDVNKELPECDGLYYGKKDDTNSMWKVVYKNNAWFLSGYPEHEFPLTKWTEIY